MRLSFLVAACAAATSLGAQAGPPARPDSTRADTAQAARAPRDSVKTPFAASFVPGRLGRAYRWGRDEMHQTGAINLAELIALVPGASVMRSGLLLAPNVVTWLGETGRVRIFLDGVELDDLSWRNGAVPDIGSMSLWSLAEVVAEPTPSELRVHLKSWSVYRTTPETKIDVATGDQEVNIYRGYYGRRYQSGLGLQFGFQQFNSRVSNPGGDGDGLGLFGRLGWAKNDWSYDLSTLRERRSRNSTRQFGDAGAIPPLDGTANETILRIGYRSADSSSRWAQLLVARRAYAEKSPRAAASAFVAADSADTTAIRAQVVLTGGVSIGGLQLTASARYRGSSDTSSITPSIRASWQRGPLVAQAFVERNGLDSMLRADVGVDYAIGSRWGLVGQYSRRAPFGESAADASGFIRVEGRADFGRARFTGGLVRRDSIVLAPPAVFNQDIPAASVAASTGETFSATVPLWKAIRVVARGTIWNEATFYRPQNEISAQLGLDTDWRARFPRGEFTIRAWVIADHRGGMLVPGPETATVLQTATPFSSILEIRIKSATIFWQFRNFLGTRYETVPGYFMPDRINLYGVRWNFSN